MHHFINSVHFAVCFEVFPDQNVIQSDRMLLISAAENGPVDPCCHFWVGAEVLFQVTAEADYPKQTAFDEDRCAYLFI